MVGGLLSGFAICWLTGELRLRAQLDRCYSLSYWLSADTSNGARQDRHGKQTFSRKPELLLFRCHFGACVFLLPPQFSAEVFGLKDLTKFDLRSSAKWGALQPFDGFVHRSHLP